MLWVEIYVTVHTFLTPGFPVATITRQLGISLPIVYAYLRCEAPLVPNGPSSDGRRRC